jgi:pimeloyl-ACP methyl ester carboxylesterase
MPYAIINKIRVYYETSGQGDAVLLINGLSSPSVGWALQVKALAPRFSVVTFDNRGVGQTDQRCPRAVPASPQATAAVDFHPLFGRLTAQPDDLGQLVRHLPGQLERRAAPWARDTVDGRGPCRRRRWSCRSQ